MTRRGSAIPTFLLACSCVCAGLAVLGPEVGIGLPLRLMLVLAAAVLIFVVLRLERLTTERQAERLHSVTSGRFSRSLDGSVSAAIDAIRSAERELARERATPWYERKEVTQLVEAFGEPMMMIGSEGEVMLANERSIRLLGLQASPRGRHIEDLITKAELLEEIATARRGEGGRSTIRLPRADGSRVCETVTRPFPIAEGRTAVVITIRDVTDLANAIQVKTDFVANASHELRTPIASIRAAADTLEVAGGDEAMRSRLTDMIRSHSTRLDELVRDLLDLSKLESQGAPVAIKPVSMSEVAAELADILRDSCERFGVELAFDLEPRLDRIQSDRRLLMLIVKNLAENATKFAREGTAVLVEGRVLESPDGAMPGMRLRITDKGQGIPLVQQQRIFERFFQVDAARTGSERRGTGLGLAIVKHAAKLLDGSVRVQSVWGQGTTMIVDLPSCVVDQRRASKPLGQTDEAGTG